MALETKLVEHSEQKVEDLPADDILRVEVRGTPLGGRRVPAGDRRGKVAGSMSRQRKDSVPLHAHWACTSLGLSISAVNWDECNTYLVPLEECSET